MEDAEEEIRNYLRLALETVKHEGEEKFLAQIRTLGRHPTLSHVFRKKFDKYNHQSKIKKEN